MVHRKSWESCLARMFLKEDGMGTRAAVFPHNRMDLINSFHFRGVFSPFIFRPVYFRDIVFRVVFRSDVFCFASRHLVSFRVFLCCFDAFCFCSFRFCCFFSSFRGVLLRFFFKVLFFHFSFRFIVCCSVRFCSVLFDFVWFFLIFLGTRRRAWRWPPPNLLFACGSLVASTKNMWPPPSASRPFGVDGGREVGRPGDRHHCSPRLFLEELSAFLQESGHKMITD